MYEKEHLFIVMKIYLNPHLSPPCVQLARNSFYYYGASFLQGCQRLEVIYSTDYLGWGEGCPLVITQHFLMSISIPPYKSDCSAASLPHMWGKRILCKPGRPHIRKILISCSNFRDFALSLGHDSKWASFPSDHRPHILSSLNKISPFFWISNKPLLHHPLPRTPGINSLKFSVGIYKRPLGSKNFFTLCKKCM